MKKTKVNIKIYPDISKNGTDKILRVTGRLLGVVTPMESTKIMQNDAVSNRVITGPTVLLKNALEAINDLKENSVVDSEKLARLVVSTKTLSDSLDSEMWMYKSLFISAPIALVTQEIDGGKSATMECMDNAMITIDEVEDEVENS